MSNSISRKFDNIYKLLSGRSLTILSEIPDLFKCVICNELIIKAKQAMCGCNFCEKCIEIYMKNEETICPGNSTECKLDNLSNITTHHGLNKQISKIIVKCPEKICKYECQLIDMSHHLNICTKGIDKCPFNEFGCAYDKLENGQLNDHLQSDLYRHNKILIDMNGNLRNEISELKSDLMMKAERNEELLKKIKLLKKNNDKIIQLIQINNGKIYKKFFEIFMKHFLGENNVNESMPPASRVNIKENIRKEFNLEIQDIMNQCESEILDLFVKPRDIELEIHEKTHKLERLLDFHYPNIFTFSISSISELRNPIYSNNFTFRKYTYNMRIKCENSGDRFYVYFCLSPGPCDDYLTWPFNERVTIGLAPGNENVKLFIRKHLIIHRSSFESSHFYFFRHSEILGQELMEKPCTLECSINIDCDDYGVCHYDEGYTDDEDYDDDFAEFF